jgi:hypothetical protein
LGVSVKRCAKRSEGPHRIWAFGGEKGRHIGIDQSGPGRDRIGSMLARVIAVRQGRRNAALRPG